MSTSSTNSKEHDKLELSNDELSINEKKVPTFIEEKWPLKRLLLPITLLISVILPLVFGYTIFQGQLKWTILFGLEGIVLIPAFFGSILAITRKRKEFAKIMFLLKFLSEEKDLNSSDVAEETGVFGEETIRELFAELVDEEVIVRNESPDERQ